MSELTGRHTGCPRRDAPTEGTKARALYDELMTGKPVRLSDFGARAASTLCYLQDFYGVDYVRLSKGLFQWRPSE